MNYLKKIIAFSLSFVILLSFTNCTNIYAEEKYSEEDIYLLAQLINREAGGEPTKGKVAVAEVVRNRINSNLFPNTVYEVTYQPRQFSSVPLLEGTVPTEEELNIAYIVLNKNRGCFYNEDVLFFRNPVITSDISPEEEIDWGPYKYYTYVGQHAFYTCDKDCEIIDVYDPEDSVIYKTNNMNLQISIL